MCSKAAHLMHGKVREENDKVLLHSHNKACVAFIAAGNNFNMVTHAEVFPQLMSRKLQWVLRTERGRPIRPVTETALYTTELV